MRALLARLPDGTQVLFLAGHHLVVDAVTWRILLEEMEATLADLARGRAPGPAETARPSPCAPAMFLPPRHSRSRRHCLRRSVRAQPVRPSPGHPLGHSGAQAQTLHRVARAHHARIDDLLLAAVVRASGRLRGRPAVTVGLERHGRDLIRMPISA